ncbi:MAG TPA: lanthionine synthetase LanC family protein, partial [Pyrinomonadaceae bacterium]|nr:lanthionine synthetase LanC family protein [Pyrinomonadaceae bacterium]
LGMLWDEAPLLDEAECTALELSERIEADAHLDIISGTAGGLGALLSLYRCHPSPRNLAAAIRCGDHLIARACSMPEGLAWQTEVPSMKPLTGFSHGAAGIAWALLELFDVTGVERFRRVAYEAIAYERSVFSVAQANWPDFRSPQPASEVSEEYQPRFTAMWCHGAGGIGLARLAALKHFEDKLICDDVHAALKAIRTEGFNYNHSLCHGDLGNLELLSQASRILRDSICTAEVERKASEILTTIKQHGWLCGVPHEVESPGFMTGLAGIGYGLLRQAHPDRIPSVLLLQPPGVKLN